MNGEHREKYRGRVEEPAARRYVKRVLPVECRDAVFRKRRPDLARSTQFHRSQLGCGAVRAVGHWSDAGLEKVVGERIDATEHVSSAGCRCLRKNTNDVRRHPRIQRDQEEDFRLRREGVRVRCVAKLLEGRGSSDEGLVELTIGDREAKQSTVSEAEGEPAEDVHSIVRNVHEVTVVPVQLKVVDGGIDARDAEARVHERR